MGTDGGGAVFFVEFCTWGAQREAEAIEHEHDEPEPEPARMNVVAVADARDEARKEHERKVVVSIIRRIYAWLEREGTTPAELFAKLDKDGSGEIYVKIKILR